MIKTAKEALATHLGWDIKELSDDYRYTGVLYNIPVYNIGNNYYCCSRINPAKEIGMDITNDLKWWQVQDAYIDTFYYLNMAIAVYDMQKARKALWKAHKADYLFNSRDLIQLRIDECKIKFKEWLLKYTR